MKHIDNVSDNEILEALLRTFFEIINNPDGLNKIEYLGLPPCFFTNEMIRRVKKLRKTVQKSITLEKLLNEYGKGK